MAAELIELGVDVHEMFRRLYENVPFAKLQLLARVLARVERYDDGRLTISYIKRERLRGDRRRRELLRGHRRPHPRGRGHGGRGARARAAQGGPRGDQQGEPAAADRRRRRERDRPQGGRRRPPPGGRVLDREVPRRAGRVPPRRDRRAARPADCGATVSPHGCAGLPSGVLLVAKPAGITSHDVVERVRRGAARARAEGRPRGHARPVRDRPAAVLVGRATRVQRFFMALPKTYGTTARFGATLRHRRPDRDHHRDRRARRRGRRASGAAAPGRRDRAARAADVRGQGRRRAPLPKARRGEAFETPVRPVRVSRLELLEFDERRSARASRSTARAAPTCASWSPTSASSPAPAPTASRSSDGDRALPARGRRRGASDRARRGARFLPERATGPRGGAAAWATAALRR